MMSAGEKEIVLASEEVQRRNIQSMLEHGNNTRTLFRDLEDKVNHLQEQIRLQDQTIAELRNMLSQLQMKMYQGGT